VSVMTRAKYITPHVHRTPKFVCGSVNTVALEALTKAPRARITSWLSFVSACGCYVYEIRLGDIIECTSIDTYLYY
jgi:hypothetical protein